MLDFSQDVANIQQSCLNLVELLQARALHQPQQVAYRFLADGETETAQVTYAELDRQSRAIASHLQALNLSGERALLLYPPGLDYLAAFFGCLYAKVVAVPAYPPRNARNIPRIQAIASDAKAAIALTNSASIAKTQALLKDVTQLQWLATDDLPAQLASTWQKPLIEPDTLAFLQYTSGSTGTPKGVMLTHSNLLHNSATTYECMEHSAASVFVSWLPTYHDMGLIGGILQPLYGGFPCILMPPAAFLQSPYRWLQAISRYRGTTSGAPNFAYQLCIEKITAQQRQKLDLSSWDVAFNGAEPIRSATLEQFSATFASCGFRHQAFYPCYGLAEASLMVTGSCKSQAPAVIEVEKAALEQNRVVVGSNNEYTCKLVSCGQSIPDEQIAIAHPDTKQHCLPHEIGEIWVSSPSVGQGYWQREEETVSTFQATIAGTEQPFLRTGDLGFLHQGELFVTSRAKDLIIIRGRNLYPQDIELTAEQSHPCLRRGSSAAFSIEVGNEELVVVQEVEFRAKPDIEEVASAIRQAIAQEHEVQVYGVVLIKAGSIPKTSSGKIQRRACKSLFLADKLDCLGSSILEAQTSIKLPGEDVESCLQAIVGQVLQIKPEINRAIASFGLDSLKVFELKNAIESNLGVDVPVAELFADISIAQLASKIRASSAVKQPLTLNPAARNYELSFAQERLWFLEQLEPENLAYNLAASVNLTGKLHVAALKQSLNAIIHRHEVLRTKFEAKLGKPYQIVVEQQLNLDIADISEYLEQESEIRRLSQEIARLPFDLQAGCLLRAKLVKLASDKHILLLGVHHIIFDGWSTNIFLQELATYYAAFTEGKTPTLAELSIQYADFASWQKQCLQAEALETQTSYWKQQLKDLSVLDLHTDFPRLSVQSYRGARQTFKLPQPVVEALTQLSQQENTTLFITLLTAFKILLHRYTSNDDIAVGSAIANRNRSEVEGIIGFFVNTLVLRTNLAHNPSFRELLQKVKTTAIEAYAHQDLPFEQLVKELQPQRHLSHNPLVQVMVDFQQAPPTFELPDLSMQLADMETGTGKFDLTLSFLNSEQRLLGSIEYNACLFKEEAIARMVGHLQTLLADIVTNCDCRLSDLSLITKEERQQLLEIGKWGVEDVDREITIHSLFEQQVEKTPDNIAVVFENQQLTYAELNNRSNKIATYLQTLGVGAEVLVGICVERSPAMIIGILAILKAGGAYLPLDPTYPQERLTFMLNDSQVPILLTQQHLQALLPQTQAQVIYLDTDWEIPLNPPCPLVPSSPCPLVPLSPLAYVIYTSGSTGKPKGVAIQHNSVANFTQAASLEYGIEPGDRILQFASLSFDTAVEEIFPTLVRGATLVLRTDAMLSSMATFVQKCSDLQITVLDLPTAFWQQLTQELATGKLVLPKLLRLVIIGGEKALPQYLAMWSKHTDGRVRILNTYGPTETTVVATVCDLSVENTEQVPIGRAISNVQTYVLDRYLQPVPIGIPGELYIGGGGVARGYLNQSELTQTKFIPNPFNHSGDRLYKTGDLVCYREDGNLEFLNRIDNQVKIRGFRIELDEVEAVLVQYPTVKQAVAIAKEQRLVAYIVGEISKVQLQNFLKKQLPEYMIPHTFVVLESLPLLPNGKVDRQALLALDAPIVLDNSFVSPRTPEEQLLADCWAKVLGVEKVGIDDNFFELGGHSLLATQLIAQVQATFAVDLPLNYIFQFPTVASLSAAISQIEQIQSDTNWQLPAIVPTPQLQYQPFPLNDIQQAYWIGRSEAFELGNIATHGYLEVESIDLDLERFNLAWQRLIERHQMLRAIFLPDGQQQILEQVPPYQIQILDLRGQSIESVNAQLQVVRESMSHQMLPCDRFPLFDIRALLLDEHRTRLHFSMDGLIADAWSYQIIGRELAQLYANPEVVLPEIEISFRDYILAELAAKNSQLAQRSLEYWQNRIPALPPAPELPLVQNPASVKQPCFKRRSSRLNSRTWLQLKTQATVAGVTATEVLLAAFAEVLAVWSKNPQFTICLTLFNRLPLHPQVNEVVGEFTSLNLLAVDNADRESFTARVKRLQAQLWEDIDHRYISGVQVLRELIRLQGRASGGLMPVVFTSTLHQDSSDEQTFPLGWLGDRVYELTQTSQVLLDVQVAEEAGELVFNWDAVEELFPTGLLDDMFAAYGNLLESLVSSQSWQTVPQLVPAMQVVVDAPVSEQLLHTLVAKRVHQSPEQVAVVSRDRTLTYQQLWQLANQLGQQLRELGVCPNQLVAVVMEKGWEQVVAVLGVLIAGAAYVPIDPILPEERRSQLLDCSDVKVVVTQSWLEKCQHVEKEIFVDCLDGNGDRVLEFVQQPDDLAYVIYTSGSTGVPKGVAIDHRGAVNTILDVNERFGVNAGDRVLALSALSFDLSVYDVFGTLAAGGTIVMPDDVRDPGCWAQLLVREGVTVWNSVPALMQMMVEYAKNQPSVLACLRLVLLSGDWLPVSLPSQLQDMVPGVEVVSLGGATEASIWSILYPVSQVDPSWKSIPYGKAMLNQRFYVLNHTLDACPVWVSGHLYIGGVGLAQGYWQDVEKTNASFIVHPRTGERLYRTGDLGRYLPDGNIEFLGREDFQVKVGGYRIELGEVESALVQHDVVKEVVVLALGEQHKQLLAFVVCQRDANISDRLRCFLANKLPAYMIPVRFVVLDTLPLTPNGKVDRQALAKLDCSDDVVIDVAPRTDVEIALAEIWGKILGLSQVGVNGNFFQMGGDSLLATQVISQVRDRWNIDLPLRSLFEYPDIARFSRQIERAQPISAAQDADKSRIAPVSRSLYRKKHLSTNV